jgi:hypothetical protein
MSAPTKLAFVPRHDNRQAREWRRVLNDPGRLRLTAELGRAPGLIGASPALREHDGACVGPEVHLASVRLRCVCHAVALGDERSTSFYACQRMSSRARWTPGTSSQAAARRHLRRDVVNHTGSVSIPKRFGIVLDREKEDGEHGPSQHNPDVAF